MARDVAHLVGAGAAYPTIAEDFAESFRVQKTLTPDIWVAAHASQYGMKEKRRSGSFVDPDGYRTRSTDSSRATSSSSPASGSRT